jgi:threonine dehydratase
MKKVIEFVRIEDACKRIQGIANKTPVMTSSTLDGLTGASVHLKCENLQRAGSFKFRGAYNAVSLLAPEERRKGVIAHSSGNHAQALALVGRLLDIPAVVVMPKNSSSVKIKAVRGYGAEIVMCEPTLKSREETTARLIADKGYTLIHPYDNDNVIAGAGTACYELISQVADLDYILCPVGGGGLISGTSIAAKGSFPNIKVVGVEPERANDAYLSFTMGQMVQNTSTDTIADGLRTNLCQRTFDIIRQNVDDIVLVSEEDIVSAMRFLWERMKLVVEPSGVVSLAGILSEKLDGKNARVGVIVSGGNVDLEAFFKGYERQLDDYP